MKKHGPEISIPELERIVATYITSSHNLNYALKITGHPGVGKSAIVKKVTERLNYFFIDTRLAFKENVDLGGYPVPDSESGQMIYYRPKFIPPASIPEGYSGIVWFLDESNRAHPTVIQTLFQIITEKKCGEHMLPEKTAIILAGNLGDMDGTTITDFDDSALDGRLAIFHLKPSAEHWLPWAYDTGIHPSIIRYISMFPEKLWDERNINPNPRGWHQLSNAFIHSYAIDSEDALSELLNTEDTTIVKLAGTLIGEITAHDFIMQITSPRMITSRDILEGSEEKLKQMKNRSIPSEDLLWALNGTIEIMKEIAIQGGGNIPAANLVDLANVLRFIACSRGDIGMTYFFLLLKECGLFTSIPEAVKTINDQSIRDELRQKLGNLLK